MYKIAIVLQILDGLLTYIALSLYGIHWEGNPILAYFMQYSVLWTLVCFKSAAIAIIVLVTRLYPFTKILVTLNVIYYFAAILPWCYLISDHFAKVL